MLLLNPKNAAHARDNILKRDLRFIQLSSDLDLDGSEHGNFRANHIGRDFYFGPAAKVGPSLGRGMQGAGVLQDKNIRITADDFASPAHPGVDTKKALLGRKCCQDFSNTFGFGHANIIT